MDYQREFEIAKSNLDMMEEGFEEYFLYICKKTYLHNILAQQDNLVPDNTIYQLRNWQYDLADIIEYYYT